MDKKIRLRQIWFILSLVVLLIISLNFTFLFLSKKQIQKIKQEIQEKNRPANLELIYIKPNNCPQCSELNDLIQAIGQQKVKITGIKEVDQSSAKDLIKKYKITKLPNLIIQGEIKKNQEFFNAFSSIGKLENNALVLEKVKPPFLDLKTKQVRGLVDVLVLYDSLCSECYDYKVHSQILKNFGVNSEPVYYDIKEIQGKNLVRKYKIKLVPTVILKGDFQVYDNLMEIWDNVGTIEKDAIVLRDGVKGLGTYKDLSKNKVIKQQSQEQSSVENYKNLSASEFKDLAEQKDVLILDVRTPQEFQQSRLENAVNIPVQELENRLDEVKKLSKGKKILVYCKTGRRSKIASEILVRNGFKNVFNLQNGIVDWINKGFKVIK